MRRNTLICGWWLLGLALAGAHPLTVREVNYPLVAGFDRFYSEQDPAGYLAQGGVLLINELNCVACHAPGPAWAARLPGVKGPDLSGVKARLRDAVVLQLMIRNPRFLKRATVMPSLFAASDRDEEELDALFHYLASLPGPEAQPMLLGEVEQGKLLYHQTGCVACHEPDPAYVPPGWPPELPMERPGMASLSIRWAEYWKADFLTQFLMDPGRFHPGRRMPGMGLSEAEAAHITAYLQNQGPGNADDLASFVPDPDLVETGKRLFVSKRCAACHEVNPVEAPRPDGAKSLLALQSLEAGCLADEPQAGGVPHFFLSDLQKTALRGGIELVRHQPPEQGPAPAAEDLLLRHDCFACHTVQGRGGPESPREPFFGALDPTAADRDRWLPPPLEEPGRGTRSPVRKTDACAPVQGLFGKP